MPLQGRTLDESSVGPWLQDTMSCCPACGSDRPIVGHIRRGGARTTSTSVRPSEQAYRVEGSLPAQILAMNNAWPSVAVLLVQGARPLRTKPLLCLSNGYVRCNGSPVLGLTVTKRSRPNAADYSSGLWCTSANHSKHRAFSTSSPALGRSASKGRVSRPKGSNPFRQAARGQKIQERTPDASPGESHAAIEPAPNVASHIEVSQNGQNVLTWRDYDPIGGMPLPGGELGESEIKRIFGKEIVDTDTGNYVLSVMHWRRMSGALIDVGLKFPQDRGVNQDMALKALQYVREIAPDIDEEALGVQWANEEEQRLRQEIQTRAVKLGLYKAAPEDVVEDDQGTDEGRERSGQSALQRMRKLNEEEFEEEQARRAAEEERAQIATIHASRGPLELGGGVQPVTESVEAVRGSASIAIRRPEPKAWLQPVERKPWVKYYEEQAQIIKDQAIPALSMVQRIGPSFLTLLVVLAGAYYLSENYTPPPKSARIWPETPPSIVTVSALSFILVVTFMLGRLPPLWRTLNKYMTIVPAYPYALGLVGATFRHDTVAHLAPNLICLWLFGLLLHEDVGRGTFLGIYMASGAFGGFSSLLYNVARKQWAVYIFGSSGCVIGVVATACTLGPNRTVTIFGFDIPVAAWVFLALFGAAESVAMFRALQTTIDHAGHVGGMAMGIVSGLYLRNKTKGQQMVERQPL